MRNSFIFLIIVLAAALFGYKYLLQLTSTTDDAAFGPAQEYTCFGGQVFSVAYTSDEQVARLRFANERVFTLEYVSQDDQDGTKFANAGDQIMLWLRDGNAFVQERDGVTYSACRISG